jgi:hypothetical protein
VAVVPAAEIWCSLVGYASYVQFGRLRLLLASLLNKYRHLVASKQEYEEFSAESQVQILRSVCGKLRRHHDSPSEEYHGRPWEAMAETMTTHNNPDNQ